MAYVKLVKCAQNKSDCFAYCERKCIILTDTVFFEYKRYGKTVSVL